MVYSFIALAAALVGAVAYLGLTFTPIEAMLAGLAALSVLVVMLERTLRRRAESRLERAIEDLSRLLSTDAQAGQVLSQRINAIADIDAGSRIEILEADISVLGTVVRQVAEAVANLEDNGVTARAMGGAVPGDAEKAETAADLRAFVDELAEAPPEPKISQEQLRQAIDDDKLALHLQPIVRLPQRRNYGYDLVARLVLEDGQFAEAGEFMPRRGGDNLVRQIETRAFIDAMTVLTRAHVLGEKMVILTPLSRPTLAGLEFVEAMIGQLDANRSMAQDFGFRMTERDFRAMSAAESAGLKALVDKGAQVSLWALKSLRLDFNELAERGVSSVRVDAPRFVTQPTSLTDYHSSDVAPYMKRFGIELVVEDVTNEQQALSLIEDGVRLAVGSHLGLPATIRPDLLVEGNGAPAIARAGALR